jgi:hypothetical protein
MPLVNFSNLDFNQIKTSLIDYLKSNSNFTDYDFEGSNLSSILDVLAYNTYITSYNANMVANEVFIDSATLRENVVALARNIGYIPRSRKAAQATINQDSKVFFLQEIEDERYELIFGDGIFGKKLEEGNFIEVGYITSNGDSGNGISQFTFAGRITYNRNSIEYTVTSGISLLTTGLISSGGENIEPVESIKRYAPRIYASQNRTVTANDYETLIPAKIYPETESISVFGGEDLIPPQYGKVFISIKPRSGDFLPNLIKDNIKRDLKKYGVAGIVPEILDLKYLYLEINSKVYYDTNLAPSAEYVSSIIQNNTTKYASSTEMNKYGARFKYSKFLKTIDESHEAVTSTIVRRNIGNVNYKKGIITLNPINIQAGKIKDGQAIVELSTTPHSNDVIGLQDLYLQLDISSSIFEMVVDSISSGLDPSASSYIQSSSYANGLLVRPTSNIGGVSSQNGRPSTAFSLETSGVSTPSGSSGVSTPSAPSSSAPSGPSGY